ncbi:hypothetical protein Neosp_005229 [[Neocosmospora] mangrovei]
MLPTLSCTLQSLLEQQDWTAVIGVMGARARDITRTEDDDSNFEAYWRFTSPAPPARQRVAYMYCVSVAVTTVGTPTETSANNHAIDSIIAIPNHSTCCNDIMLQQHYNAGGRKPESCIELVDIIVVRLLERDQRIVEPRLGNVLHMPRTQA